MVASRSLNEWVIESLIQPICSKQLINSVMVIESLKWFI